MSEKQNKIRQALRVKPEINPKEEIEASIQLIVDYLKAFPALKQLVLGISGGQDSTLVGRLGQLAVERMREETGDNAYKMVAVRLPYGQQADEDDAQKALAFIQADRTLSVNIKPAVDAQVSEIEASGLKIHDFNKGNIKARQRMIIQYAIAGELGAVVLGTDHAAEALTGFYTKFGDGAADLMPIWRLDKRQGRALLEELGAPKELYEKIPTADLEEDRPQLPDEKALGVTYDEIDDYLEGKKVSKEASDIIERWWDRTDHKRHLPINLYDTWWRKEN